jgi:ribonucleoside-diphosphate reductase alpha chain
MPDGREIRVNSPVDAFARLIYARCEQLGVFDEPGEGTLVAAMLSAKEPKTTAEGTLSWTVDVINHATGDDFCMFLKEVQLADGRKRPLSVWLAGDYPKSLDGLCKALSLDLRIADVGWALRKLDQLRDVSEHRGEFRAQVPGSTKTTWYPSTVAYIAALIQYRMHVHGYCDDHGRPLGKTTLSVVETNAPEAKHRAAIGLDCSACGGVGTVRREGGCDVCVSCGQSRCS